MNSDFPGYFPVHFPPSFFVLFPILKKDEKDVEDEKGQGVFLGGGVWGKSQKRYYFQSKDGALSISEIRSEQKKKGRGGGTACV